MCQVKRNSNECSAEEQADEAKDVDRQSKPVVAGPDGRESVYIAIVCAIMSFLCSAGFRSLGFLYIGIMDTFYVSRQEASWPLSLIGAMTNLSGILAGPLVQRFPLRPVILCGALLAACGMIISFFAGNIPALTVTLGVLYGSGCGVVFTVINVTLSQYFEKYRAVAFGIVYAGSTMASFVFPNLLLALNQIYPFKSVLLLFGGIILNMFALAIFIKEPSWVLNNSNASSHPQKATLKESLSIMKEPIFYLLLVSNIFFQFGFDAFMTTLVDFAVDRGATLQEAVNLLPWFSLADVVGRGLMPFLADKGFIKRQNLIMICYIFTGAFTMGFPLSTTYAELIIFILLMGSFCGCAAVLFCCVVGDYIGIRRLPLAFGVLGTVNGCFYFTKPFFFGHFRDVVKSYDGMFLVTGALTLGTGLAWVIVFIRERAQESKLRQEKADGLAIGGSVTPATVFGAARCGSFLGSQSSIDENAMKDIAIVENILEEITKNQDDQEGIVMAVEAKDADGKLDQNDSVKL